MAFSESDYTYLRELVQSESANLLSPGRNLQFASRLAPVARRAGAASVQELVAMLRSDNTSPLHRAVAEALTINETSFFRDASFFEAVRSVILPQLIANNQTSRRLRIWSAASSTGQEAYSLAMLICEHVPSLEDWDVQILGTDISSRVIEVARCGRYRRLEVNRGLPARFLLKYMVREGDEWEVAPAVRRLCTFRPMNLCNWHSGLPTFDLVLLRNVLLYFSRRDRTSVLENIHRQMQPEGYLILGAAEQAEDSTERFVPQFAGQCYFYRPAPQG